MTANGKHRFSDELRAIPVWAGVLATLAFLVLPFVFFIVISHDKNAPPAPLRALLGFLVGAGVACYLLLGGYVNRDASRRGMNRLAWTLIAFFVPNALGFILYFALRKPLLTSCSQCGTSTQPGFTFCSRCGNRLQPVCPHCQHGVEAGSVYCPYCGGGVNEAPQAPATPPVPA